MPARGERESPEPPEWWNLELYDFLSDLPDQGWAWEFMRRARLKEVFKEVSIDSPVDAMNPNPKLEGPDSETELEVLDELYPDFWDCYKKYDEIEETNLPDFFPPPIFIPGKWPEGFYGVKFINNDYYLSNIIKPDLRVDMNQSDRMIRRYFASLLLELRKSNPRPGRVSPRPKEWVKNRSLQIWDLRQFRVYWRRIADLAYEKDIEYRYDIDKAIEAYEISERFIDEGNWINLARSNWSKKAF